MSAETKDALEIALVNHMVDVGYFKEGQIVADWITIVACIPPDRGNSKETIYSVFCSDRTMTHNAKGLASWYLFEAPHASRKLD